MLFLIAILLCSDVMPSFRLKYKYFMFIIKIIKLISLTAIFSFGRLLPVFRNHFINYPTPHASCESVLELNSAG